MSVCLLVFDIESYAQPKLSKYNVGGHKLSPSSVSSRCLFTMEEKPPPSTSFKALMPVT